MTRIVRRLSQDEAKMLGFQVKKDDIGRINSARYSLTPEQHDQIDELRGISRKREFVETQKKLDKNGEVLSTIEKLQSEPIDIPSNFEIIKISTSKTTGQQWIQYAAKKEVDVNEIDFSSVFSGKIERVKISPKSINECIFDRLVYTDVHVGMNPNDDGYSLYGGKWDKEELDNRLQKVVDLVVSERKSKILRIDDLGDYMDGFRAETSRGGHKLPQNMTDQESFDAGVLFKIKMIDALVEYYDEIHCWNVCIDNHAAAWGYVVNSAFKTYVEMKYPNVKVTNQRKFIDYYTIGDYVFVITHGKDDKNLKFGFKATLDKQQENKIDNYLAENDIVGKKLKIEFSKGDSHQWIMDNTTSMRFNYCSYPAFSPSSSWVQVNFQKGKSGFVFFNYRDDRKTVHEYEFK